MGGEEERGSRKANQSHGCGCGRGGRARHWPHSDASSENLMPFIEDSVEPGNVIHTDGWLGYQPLAVC